MGVWIIAGVVLILALLVRWRHALRGWLLSAAGGLVVLCLVQAIGALLPVNLLWRCVVFWACREPLACWCAI